VAVVVVDASQTVSWGSVVRAQDAIRQAGIEEVYFAVTTAAGPGAGVRVNGVPLGGERELERPPGREVRDRIIRVTGSWARYHELRLVLVNAVPWKTEVPWLFDVEFTSRGGEPIRVSLDGESAAIVLTGGGRVRIPFPPGPQPGLLRPGERFRRLLVIPRREGAWGARIEAVLPRGTPIVSNKAHQHDGIADRFEDQAEARRTAGNPILAGRDEWSWSDDLRRRGQAIMRLERATGQDAELALGVLGGIVPGTDDEPSCRLLAALVALKLRPEVGKRLLETLRRDTSDPVLAEAVEQVLALDR
jgi:hypothetical protein